MLLPSHTEGLPNVVLEAMTMGVPVAATNVGGVGGLLDHGRCGVILNQDPNSWVDRIGYLLTSTDRRTKIAKLARQRIESHYTFAQRMERVHHIYQRVLGTRFITDTGMALTYPGNGVDGAVRNSPQLHCLITEI